MNKLLVSLVLMAHGLIVGAQSFGNFKSGSSLPDNPLWLSWWPVKLGQSWFLSALGLEGSIVDRAFGLLWLVSGLALTAAGLGLPGWFVPLDASRNLALWGGSISLLMLLLYLHPFFLVGMLVDLFILAALLFKPGMLNL